MEKRENFLEEIYTETARRTLERVKREKATKLSKKTLKMIDLTEKIYKTLYGF